MAWLQEHTYNIAIATSCGIKMSEINADKGAAMQAATPVRECVRHPISLCRLSLLLLSSSMSMSLINIYHSIQLDAIGLTFLLNYIYTRLFVFYCWLLFAHCQLATIIISAPATPPPPASLTFRFCFEHGFHHCFDTVAVDFIRFSPLIDILFGITQII